MSKKLWHSFAGLSQGVRRSVGGLATILGPLWAGGLTENLYIMMGVMMALLALLMVFNKNKPFVHHHVGLQGERIGLKRAASPQVVPRVSCLLKINLCFHCFIDGIFLVTVTPLI